MRANPKEGYQWYLKQADYALNAVETGLEMRLRDSVAQFSVNMPVEGETTKAQRDSASSEIDRENIRIIFPDFTEQFKIDSAMLWVKRLSFRGLHNQALKIADAANWVREIYASDPEKYRLAYADFLLWKGQALMYSSRARDAIATYKENLDILAPYALENIKHDQLKYSEFELWRIGRVTGRTYNNLGYTYWIYFGKYKPAITKLNQALEYFKLAKLVEEEANAKDNMGRIHAMLWHEPASRLLIEDGLKKREAQRMVYRAALSRVSLAAMQYRFRYWQIALENAEKALETFRTLDVRRGEGLARLTRAMVYRSMAEALQDQGVDTELAIKHVNDAVEDLTFVQRIFKEAVQEKIRYVYALNEMGSCYRTLYFLLAHQGVARERQDKIYDDGVSYYMDAIKETKDNDYFIEELDTKQDLAVLHMRAGKNEKAEKELSEIRKIIPDSHQFVAGKGLEKLPEEDTTDAYYKLMGHVDMLAGALLFDKAKKSADASASRRMILSAMEHYVLAVAYYYRYSSISSNTYVMTTDRIYRRLSQCDSDLIGKIKKEYLPELFSKYNIPLEGVKPLFDAIFEMLGA
jgi:tetratricopeptide (TPR) repeat protein